MQKKRIPDGEKYFLAEYIEKGDDFLIYDKPADIFLPSVYDTFGNHFTDLQFTKNGEFCILALDDQLHDLTGKQRDYKLGIVKGAQFNNDIFNYGYYLMLDIPTQTVHPIPV